jgi:oligo-1,6-glucosidase
MTHPSRGELDMAFCFDVLEPPGKERFSSYVYNPLYLKQYFSDWMKNYAGRCQMAIFFNNHDNPRMLSKIDPEGEYRSIVAKMLAMLQLTLKGTPFIYQGDELGAVNFPFKSIEDMRDVESLNFYRQYCETMTSDEAFARVLSGSRDHARIPMQWNTDQNSGFTEGEPWIVCAHDEYNADSEIKKEDSVFWFYKDLIAIRKRGEALIYGDIEIIKTDPKPVFAYYRSFGEEKWLIVINFSEKEQPLPPVDGFELVLCNYGDTERIILLPYEAILYQKTKRQK